MLIFVKTELFKLIEFLYKNFKKPPSLNIVNEGGVNHLTS